MPNTQRRVAVIGAGLIGGSIARALHGRPDVQVIVSDRSPETRARVRAAGIPVTEIPVEAVHRADLTVLAVPPSQIDQVAMDIRRALPRHGLLLETGCVTRDLKSVIGVLARVRPDVHFVTSTPVVGGARGGFQHADPNLFANAAWIVGGPETDAAARAEVVSFVRSLGVDRLCLDLGPEDRDAVVGVVELAPHLMVPVMAAFLAGADGTTPVRPALCQQALRLASSPAPLWGEVLTAGWATVAPVIDRLGSHLETLIFGLSSASEIEEYRTLVSERRAPVTARYGDGVILPSGDPQSDHQVRIAEMIAYAFVRAGADVFGPDDARTGLVADLAGPAFADVTLLANQGMAALLAARKRDDHAVLTAFRDAIEDAESVVGEAWRVLSDLRAAKPSELVVFGVGDLGPGAGAPTPPSFDACFRAANRAYAAAARRAPELAH